MIELNFPNAVRDKEDLFGRDGEIDLARRALNSRSRQPIVILGERLIGKTSLQQVIARQLEAESDHLLRFVFPPPAYTFPLYAGEIFDTLSSLADSTGASNHAVHGQERPLASATTQSEYLTFYRNLLGTYNKSTFVLCFDEFDSLLHKCPAAEQTAILDFTLALVERSDLPLVLLFTMSNPTEQIGKAYPFRFLSKASIIPLNPLGTVDTIEMVSTLLASRFKVPSGIRAEILRLSGGHPYFVKLLLQGLLDAFPGTDERGGITATMLDLAVKRATSSLEARFALINVLSEHLSERERTALKWLAFRSGSVQVSGVDPDYAEALLNLVRRNYLRQDGRGEISFWIGLLSEWVQANAHWVPTAPTESVSGVPLQLEQESMGLQRLTIDDRQNVVYRGSQEIRLTRLSYRTLCCLGRRVGKPVLKEILAEEVWKGTRDAFDMARIDQVIKRLRESLGDDARNSTYIETRPGHGYVLHHATFIWASGKTSQD